MAALNPEIIQDTAGQYGPKGTFWLRIVPDPTAEGYEFATPTGHSRTFDNRQSMFRLGTTFPTGGQVRVDALDVTSRPPEVATWPPVVPPPPPPPPTTIARLGAYGVCPGHAARVWTAAVHTEMVKKAADMGAGHRLLWRVEGYADTTTDRIVKDCLANGLDPMLVVGGSAGPGVMTTAPNIGTQLAQRYGDTAVYEGPNEPDLNGWQPGPLADWEARLHAQLRAVDNDIVFGWGGLWKGTPNAFASWQPYVKAKIAKGKEVCGRYATGHFYDSPLLVLNSGTWWNDWGWWLPGNPMYAGQTAVDLFAQAGWSVPIVNSECGPFGQPTGYVSQLEQATKGRVHTAVLYCVKPDVPGYAFMWNADGTPTPYVATVQKYLAGVPVPV